MEYIFEAIRTGRLEDVKPRLHLNLGARYSYLASPMIDKATCNNFDPATYSASMAPTINNMVSSALSPPTALNQAPMPACRPMPNANADYVGVNYINGMIFGTQAPPTTTRPRRMAITSIGAEDNFAPRFGLAYDLFGDGKTSFRGGYGWAYDEPEASY